MKKQYLEAGKIVSTHGLHGEVKVLPWADDADFLTLFDRVYIGKSEYAVEESRVQKTCVLLKLAGVDDVDAAAKLREQVISIDRDDVELGEGSLFIQDLLGLPVFDGETQIGKLAEVIQMPGNDVLLVKGEHEYMIPSVPEYVLERNVDEGYIRVKLIEGMQTDAV